MNPKKSIILAIVVSIHVVQVFAGAEAPGKLIPISDDYARKQPNLLYLANTANQAWWSDKFTHRIPLLVSEPIGLERVNIPICFQHVFPERANLQAVRVVTPWGHEIASQTSMRPDKQAETIFLTSLRAHEQKIFFIYWSDDQSIQPADYDTNFYLQEKPDWYELTGEYLQLEIYKQPSREGSLIKKIHIQGSPFESILSWRQPPDYAFAGHQLALLRGARAELLENGIIRKAIRFENENCALTYFLHSKSRRLDYQLIPKDKKSGAFVSSWLPWNDMKNDMFYYEATDGIREIHPGERHELQPFLKEGWTGITDARGETAGEIFETTSLQKLKILSSPLFGGYQFALNWQANQPFNGALVAVRSGWSAMRAEYLDWKMPPGIQIGQIQAQTSHQPQPLPVFGKDYLRGYRIVFDRYLFRENEQTATRWVEKMLSLGANWIEICARGVPLWPSSWTDVTTDQREQYEWNKTLIPEFVAAAHTRGMVVKLWTRTGMGYAMLHSPRYYKFLNETDRITRDNLMIQDLIDIAQTGVDMIQLPTGGEQQTFYGRISQGKMIAEVPFPKDAEREFQAEYGMALPKWQTVYEEMEQIKLGAPHCYPFLFIRKQSNELTERMARAIKQARPDAQLDILCSGGGELRRDVDIEAKAPYLDNLEVEVPGASANLLDIKYGVKFPLAAMGNKGISVQNHFLHWFPSPRRETARLGRIYLPLAYGMTSFVQEDLETGIQHPELIHDIEDFYKFLQYTPLDSFISGSMPIKFIAILRDRNAHLDDLLKGNLRMLPHLMSAHDARVKEFLHLKHMPTDIILTGFFTPNELRKYKLLIIPSDQVLSPALAEIAAQYVKDGGNLLVEAEGINNQVIAEIAGIAKTADTHQHPTLTTVHPVLPPMTIPTRCPVGITLKTATPLAQDATGRPIITLNRFGKGQVVYSACFLIDDITKSMDKRNLTIKIIELLAGKGPIQLPDDAAQKIEATLLVNRSQYLLSVYNPAEYKDRDTTIRLDLPDIDKLKIFDLAQGTELEYKDGLSLRIPRQQIRYFLLGHDQALRLPEAKAAPAAIGYSQKPAMQFFEPIESNYVFPERKTKVKTVGIFHPTQRVANAYTYPTGAETLQRALLKAALQNVEVKLLPDMSDETLAQCDVVIMPNLKFVPDNLASRWETRLRNFVNQGRSAMIICHSAGNKRLFAPSFPEIGAFNGLTPEQNMKIVRQHPVTEGFKPGDIFAQSFFEYVELLSEEGETLIEGIKPNACPTPALTVGMLGKGKVVMCGFGLGLGVSRPGATKALEKEPEGAELRILTNAVLWLCDNQL